MKFKPFLAVFIALISAVSSAAAQKAEVTISLNEAFFDSLLDSVFQNFEPPEFSMASRISPGGGDENSLAFDSWANPLQPYLFGPQISEIDATKNECSETVKVLREMRGVRTAVRFRDGKVFVPLAFSGNYAAPLIGCVEFAGWAESNLELEFDQNSQRLIGKVRVNSVNLNGTGGIGGSVVARLIQGSIDKKMNPIEIISLDKVSFGVPVQRSGTIRMRAQKIRTEVGSGTLNIRVEYDFVKG